MGLREPHHVRNYPLAGDVIECRFGDEGEAGDTMIRVTCVVEDHVGYKQYGKGWSWKHLSDWKRWLETSQLTRVIRGADELCPF